MNDHRSLRPESEALTERLRVLKETLPECFTEGRLDPVKLNDPDKIIKHIMERRKTGTVP